MKFESIITDLALMDFTALDIIDKLLQSVELINEINKLDIYLDTEDGDIIKVKKEK